MPSMFPFPSTGGNDPNRDVNRDRASTPSGGRPSSVNWAYWLQVVGAVFLILSGLVFMTTDFTGPADTDPQLQEAVLRNQRILGVFNLIAGIVLAVLAPQLRKGSKLGRRILLGVIGVILLVNVLSFVIRVGGFVLPVIVILLAVSALMMFRPSANDFVRGNESS